jgi:hypothetical protein
MPFETVMPMCKLAHYCLYPRNVPATTHYVTTVSLRVSPYTDIPVAVRLLPSSHG